MPIDVVIMDESHWRGILALIHEGLIFLDSILLFSTEHVHLSMLDFLIAVMVFLLVWDAAALWQHSKTDNDD